MTEFASLRAYPPELTSLDQECGFGECEQPAVYLVMCVPAAAMPVCPEHMDDIRISQQ